MTKVDSALPPAAPPPRHAAPVHNEAPKQSHSVGPAVKVTLSKEAQAIVKGHKP